LDALTADLSPGRGFSGQVLLPQRQALAAARGECARRRFSPAPLSNVFCLKNLPHLNTSVIYTSSPLFLLPKKDDILLLHRDEFLRHDKRRAGLGFDLLDGDALGVLDEGEARDGVDVEDGLWYDNSA
jgi:hypothetical protein